MRKAKANNRLKLTPDLQDFLRRRTTPFFDANGLSRPISFVLEEVYLQGMRDAVQTMEEKKSFNTSSKHGRCDDNCATSKTDFLPPLVR
jgi:hypothetical protein